MFSARRKPWRVLRARSLPETLRLRVVDYQVDLSFLGGIPFLILIYIVVAGTTSAVNLTDGLDGLATGASILVFAAYTLVNIWQNSQSCALEAGAKCYEVRDPLDLAVVAAAITGGIVSSEGHKIDLDRIGRVASGK